MIGYFDEEMYREHLMEYERSQLRDAVLTEMERLRPDWAETYRSAEIKTDFEKAVTYCDYEFSVRDIQTWIAAYREGRSVRLRMSD